MNLFWLIVLLLLLIWFLGGLAVPTAGSLLNILLVFVVCLIIYKLANGEKL